MLCVSYSSAISARELILTKQPDLQIEVVDSKNSVGALGLIALEAARAVRAGKSLAEVKGVAEEMVLKAKYSSALESLRFFIKIGRAPAGAENDEKDGIKAIPGIVNNNGITEFIGKERGLEATIDKTIELVPKYADINLPLHAVVTYSNDRKAAEKVIDCAKAKYNCAEIYLTEFTPVMFAAMGPIVFLCYFTG